MPRRSRKNCVATGHDRLDSSADSRGLNQHKGHHMKMSSTPSEFLRSRVIRHCAVAPALVAVGLAASYPAVADIFLKLDGTPGGSTNAFHRNEIDVSTYSQA